MMRSLGLVAAGVVCALPLLAGDRAVKDEDAKLNAFFNHYLDEEFRARPLNATRLGDHRYDAVLDDLSPKARAGWLERYRRVLRELPEQVDSAKLPRSGQIDYEIFKHDLTYSCWLAENAHPFEDDPRTYNDYLSDSIYLLLTQSSLPRAVNVKNAAARLTHLPQVVAAARESLRNPPRVFVETAIRQNRGAIAFYEHGIYEAAGETPQVSTLAAPARAAVACLKEHQQFLENDLLPRATGDWRIGKEKYARKLDLELNAGLSAAEVLREAEKEFARVENEMYVIARQLWGITVPGQPLPPDDADGRRATVSRILARSSQEHGRVETLVDDAKTVVAQLKAFIKDRDILRLPDPDHCQVQEMPEFQRGNTVAYLNPAPPLDAQAASIFAISPPPRDWDARRVTTYLEEYNRSMLQILAIHEGYPGHYVQLEYSNRHPSRIRRVLSSGVFAEGWAVYTEQMMLDQGYGQGDLALRLNQLKFYLRTVANAIIDQKMHAGDWTDEQVLAFLTRRAFQTEGEALGKVIRAKQTSCQLSTYFVGRTAFYRLRQQIQREQGDQFELGRYHEAVLAHGTLPVKYLPELVHARLREPR